jgi:hypothetical protein
VDRHHRYASGLDAVATAYEQFVFYGFIAGQQHFETSLFGRGEKLSIH